MTAKDKIKQAFNQAELTYDHHCQLQIGIGEKLLINVKNHIATAKRLIDLGCGTGITTEKLSRLFDFSDFHAIDIANRLLMKAKDRLSDHIHVYEADFDQLPSFDMQFNLAFSNMALHWSSDLYPTLKAISDILTKNGMLAFSIPLSGTLAELKPAYDLRSFLQKHKVVKYLKKAGFHSIKVYEEKIILHFDNTLSALKSIKHVGANFVDDKAHKGLHGKQLLNETHLEQLTYRIGYFIAKSSRL